MSSSFSTHWTSHSFVRQVGRLPIEIVVDPKFSPF